MTALDEKTALVIAARASAQIKNTPTANGVMMNKPTWYAVFSYLNLNSATIPATERGKTRKFSGLPVTLDESLQNGEYQITTKGTN